jgi:hypothetical protein
MDTGDQSITCFGVTAGEVDMGGVVRCEMLDGRGTYACCAWDGG